MTTDVVVNNIINDLCQRFNVASSELIPRLQAYGMAMHRFGAITAAIICIALTIIVVVVCKFNLDESDLVVPIVVIIKIVSVVILLYNIYMYIGWKYAPEVKTIEYIMYLFKN